jgi:dUTP pyrophosphatase
MTSLTIGFKKLHKDAKIPEYAKHGDAGLDLTATSIEVSADIITYGIGIAVEIPEGHVGLIYPRSSIFKKDLSLANSVGVVDAGYRGELKVKFRVIKDLDNRYIDPDRIYEIGERVAQLMIVPYPTIQFVEKEELNETKRGSGGFGSTGN